MHPKIERRGRGITLLLGSAIALGLWAYLFEQALLVLCVGSCAGAATTLLARSRPHPSILNRWPRLRDHRRVAEAAALVSTAVLGSSILALEAFDVAPLEPLSGTLAASFGSLFGLGSLWTVYPPHVRVPVERPWLRPLGFGVLYTAVAGAGFSMTAFAPIVAAGLVVAGIGQLILVVLYIGGSGTRVFAGLALAVLVWISATLNSATGMAPHLLASIAPLIVIQSLVALGVVVEGPRQSIDIADSRES